MNRYGGAGQRDAEGRTLFDRVLLLVKTDLDPPVIAEVLKCPIGTVESYISKHRRLGNLPRSGRKVTLAEPQPAPFPLLPDSPRREAGEGLSVAATQTDRAAKHRSKSAGAGNPSLAGADGRRATGPQPAAATSGGTATAALKGSARHSTGGRHGRRLNDQHHQIHHDDVSVVANGEATGAGGVLRPATPSDGFPPCNSAGEITVSPAAFSWTPATEHRLAALWTEGRSASDIARHMGITRNQVIGKAHRMCLKSRPSPIVRQHGVTLVELEPHHCRWPVGHPGEAGFHFCGKPQVGMSPYCTGHLAQAYQAGTSSNDLERERKAGRRIRAAMEAGSRSGVMLRAVGRS